MTVRKANKTLQLTYKEGRLRDQECVETLAQSTGTTVSGSISTGLQRRPTDVGGIERWLLQVSAAHPALKLHFNGEEIHVPDVRRF